MISLMYKFFIIYCLKLIYVLKIIYRTNINSQCVKITIIEGFHALSVAYRNETSKEASIEL